MPDPNLSPSISQSLGSKVGLFLDPLLVDYYLYIGQRRIRALGLVTIHAIDSFPIANDIIHMTSGQGFG